MGGIIIYRYNNIGHSIGSDVEVVIVKGLPRCADEPLTTRLAISDRIHRERIGQHLSIGQLATKAGLSKNHIWRIESGDYRYTIDILAAVCKALGLKITVE